MSALETQPMELLVKQMLLLDLEDLNSLCRVSSAIREVCSSDWFWRTKISLDFPDYEYVFEGSRPRVVYETLSRNDLSRAIELDLPSVFMYVSKGRFFHDSAFRRNWIKEAARSSSLNSLRLFLQTDDQYMLAYEWTIGEGTPETLKVFLDEIEPPTMRDIAKATLAGRIDNIEVLLNYIEERPIYLFDSMTRWELAYLPYEKIEGFERAVRYLKQQGVITSYDEIDAAVVLDDVDGVTTQPSPSIRLYGLRTGSDDMIMHLLSFDPTLTIDDSIDIEQLPRLLELGARVTDTPYPEEFPDYFLELVDEGYIEINTAIAAVLRTDEEDIGNHGRPLSKKAFLYETSTFNPDAITREKVREALLTYFDEESQYIDDLMEELEQIIDDDE